MNNKKHLNTLNSSCETDKANNHDSLLAFPQDIHTRDTSYKILGLDHLLSIDELKHYITSMDLDHEILSVGGNFKEINIHYSDFQSKLDFLVSIIKYTLCNYNEDSLEVSIIVELLKNIEYVFAEIGEFKFLLDSFYNYNDKIHYVYSDSINLLCEYNLHNDENVLTNFLFNPDIVLLTHKETK
jgi:hypothetical protein